MLSISHLRRTLKQYTPEMGLEQAHYARICDFVQTCPAPFYRATLAGHITTSTVLTDPDRQYFLLIWHIKLQRWLQPGGHCERTDQSLQASAERELLEESQLPASALRLASERIFDVDVHAIPARGAEPEHWHYDLRFHFTLLERNLPETLLAGAVWKPVAEVAALPESSLARLGRKLMASWQ